MICEALHKSKRTFRHEYVLFGFALVQAGGADGHQ